MFGNGISFAAVVKTAKHVRTFVGRRFAQLSPAFGIFGRIALANVTVLSGFAGLFPPVVTTAVRLTLDGAAVAPFLVVLGRLPTVPLVATARTRRRAIRLR